MRIVFLLTAGLDRPAGQRYGPLARGLARRGHDVTMVALHPEYASAATRRFSSDGVAVRYVGQMHARKAGSSPTRFGPLQLLRVVLESTVAMAWAAASTPHDCLHLGKPQPINGMAAVLASRVRCRSWYVDCDDYEAGSNRFSADWQRGVFAWWEDRLPVWARGVTVNTTFLRQRVAALGTPMEHIVYVPNGVDLATFVPAPSGQVAGLRAALGLDGRRVIAYAGTLSLQNHPVDLLLDALPEILAVESRTVLLMIGGGEDLGALRERVRGIGLEHAVRFTGHVSRTMLRALLGLAELTVDPVRDDPVARARSPLKIFESMALGVPVVTGDVGDRRSLLAGGGAGVLVPAGDPDALAAGITQLLADRYMLDAQRRAALGPVRAYDGPLLVERFEQVYAG